MFLGEETNAPLQHTKKQCITEYQAFNSVSSGSVLTENKKQNSSAGYTRPQNIFNVSLYAASMSMRMIRLNYQDSATTDSNICRGQVVNKKSRVLNKVLKTYDWLSGV